MNIKQVTYSLFIILIQSCAAQYMWRYVTVFVELNLYETGLCDQLHIASNISDICDIHKSIHLPEENRPVRKTHTVMTKTQFPTAWVALTE